MRSGAQRRPGGWDQPGYSAGGKTRIRIVDRSRAPGSRGKKVAFGFAAAGRQCDRSLDGAAKISKPNVGLSPERSSLNERNEKEQADVQNITVFVVRWRSRRSGEVLRFAVAGFADRDRPEKHGG